MAAGVVLVGMMLAGCAEGDPMQRIEVAQAELRGTQRAANEAQQRSVEATGQAEEATLTARDAALSEIELARLRTQATLTALQVRQAEIEARAVAGQATANAKEAQLLEDERAQARQATATAMALVMENEASKALRDERQAQWVGWLKLAGLAALLIGLMGLLIIFVIYAWKLGDWMIAWKDRKNLMYSSPDGTVFLDYSTGQPMAVLVREIDYYRRRPRIDGKSDLESVQRLPPAVIEGKSRAEELAEVDDEYDAALMVIEKAIEHFQTGDAKEIPRHHVIDVTPRQWEIGVHYIEALGLVRVEQGKKTTTQVRLSEVLYRLQHSPTPQ